MQTMKVYFPRESIWICAGILNSRINKIICCVICTKNLATNSINRYNEDNTYIVRLEGLGDSYMAVLLSDLYEGVKNQDITLVAGEQGMGNVVRSEGAVKEGMIGNLISTITNIVLDPLFILVLNWGVAGAATATVIGNLAGAGYLIHYIRFIIKGHPIRSMFLKHLLICSPIFL